MRIIHTDTDDLANPLRGGQPVRTFEINSRLANMHEAGNAQKLTNEITVLTASYKGSQAQVKRGNINYARLGITIPAWGLSSHLSFLARLPAALKRMPHDLVVEEFTPPFGFCNLQKHTNKPVVSMVQWFFFDDWQKRYKLPFEKIMRQRAAQFADRHLIVQTNKMGDYFKDLLPLANIHKVPCGINQEAFQESTNVGEYALFLGRLDTQHKGLDDLLDAWALLLNQGVHIPLWIVGAGQDELALKAQVKRLHLDSLVTFKGRLEHAAKQEVLRNCRFLVMPSRQETFGLTALEAMASSKPVIAYDIDHLNELLQPAWSHQVKLGNISALANSVQKTWQDQNGTIEMGKSGYKAAKGYLWDSLAKQQYQIYLEALGAV